MTIKEVLNGQEISTYWPPSLTLEFPDYCNENYNRQTYVVIPHSDLNKISFNRIEQEIYKDETQCECNLILDDDDNKIIVVSKKWGLYVNNEEYHYASECINNNSNMFVRIRDGIAYECVRIREEFNHLPASTITPSLLKYYCQYDTKPQNVTFIKLEHYHGWKKMTTSTSEKYYMIFEPLYYYFVSKGFSLNVKYKCVWSYAASNGYKHTNTRYILNITF